MPHLNKLHKKYSSQGLTVIGATRENFAKIQAFSIHRIPMEYKVLTRSRYSGFPQYSGIPHVFIIGADGELAYSGRANISNKEIEGYLKDRVKHFYSKYKGVSKSAIGSFLKRKYGKAYKSVVKKKDKDEVTSNFFDLVDQVGQRQIAYGNKLIEEQRIYEAYLFFSKMKKTWSGTPFYKQADEKRKFCSSKENKTEFNAGKSFAKLTRLIPKDDKGKQRLALYLQKFANKYTETKAAEEALSLADVLDY